VTVSGQRDAAASRPATIGVVGDGFGALLVYATAIYLGLEPEEVKIFGRNRDPVATYRSFADNLRQTVLRSESEAHFLPADWPTFAQIDAVAHRTPAPLLRSVRRKFNPGVAEILTEAGVVARALDYGSRVQGASEVGWLVREPGPPPHFSVYDEQAGRIGTCKHAILALGHGPLAFPGVCGEAREDSELGERIVQAYEPKDYHPGGRYLVLGSGIAAVNEWANVLDAGAQCVALRRNPTPEERDLNLPRCLLDGSGIDAFQSLDFDQRIDLLGQVLRGSAPGRKGWAERVAAAKQEGRFEEVIGEIKRIEASPSGLRLQIFLLDGTPPTELEVTGVVCATGFVKSALSLPLLRRLVEAYGIPVQRERIRLKSNCGIPPLDRSDSRLCMMGMNASSVVPNGDTIAGLKYIARRFVADVCSAEGIRHRSFPSRLALQMSLARAAAAELRGVHATEQFA
jgi:hypothetical protein